MAINSESKVKVIYNKKVSKTSKDKDAMGWFLEQIKSIPLLGENEQTIAKLANSGDTEAKLQFIKSNIRLVIKLAKQYHTKRQVMPLEDLIGHGILGLIRAIDKFEPEKGFKLSTYAYWWIRQDITRGTQDTGELIRKPGHMHGDYSKIKRIEEKYASLDRLPTYEEISAELNVLELEAAKSRKSGKPRQKWSSSKVQKLIAHFSAIVSLDATLDTDQDDESETFCARLTASELPLPEEEVDGMLLRELMGKALATLEPIELQIIQHAYLNGDAKVNYRKIAQVTGLQEVKIRHIKDRALTKLRAGFPELEQFLGYSAEAYSEEKQAA